VFPFYRGETIEDAYVLVQAVISFPFLNKNVMPPSLKTTAWSRSLTQLSVSNPAESEVSLNALANASIASYKNQR